MTTKAGFLVLVVGASGAGKDSVLRGAERELSNQKRYMFPRRVVTRQADINSEDHESISEEDFAAAEAAGQYMLSWQAHGNGYGIPVRVEHEIATGKVASINVSRHILRNAVSRFPNILVVEITADPDVRKARILSRGREQQDDASRRVQRETPPFPADAEVVRIENNEVIETAITSFTSILRKL